MNPLIAAALAEDPMAFKKEFTSALATRIEDLQAQRKLEIAQSSDVTEDDIKTAFGDDTAFDDNTGK